MFKVVFAFEDKPFLIAPPSKDNSVQVAAYPQLPRRQQAHQNGDE